MWSGRTVFAWLPVRVRFSHGTGWAWLTWVYEETTTFADGTTRIRYYAE